MRTPPRPSVRLLGKGRLANNNGSKAKEATEKRNLGSNALKFPLELVSTQLRPTQVWFLY
jgi:hypothetical protein